MKRKQPSSINRKIRVEFDHDSSTDGHVETAVVNFFKPTSEKEKEPEKILWRTINDSLLIGKYQTSGAAVDARKESAKRKIAAFDFVCYSVLLHALNLIEF